MAHKSPKINSPAPVVTFEQQIALDRLARSCPRKIVAACLRATVYSLSAVPGLARLRSDDPRAWSLLVAEARAQGLPV